MARPAALSLLVLTALLLVAPFALPGAEGGDDCSSPGSCHGCPAACAACACCQAPALTAVSSAPRPAVPQGFVAFHPLAEAPRSAAARGVFHVPKLA